jgi:hypothetical protein
MNDITNIDPAPAAKEEADNAAPTPATADPEPSEFKFLKELLNLDPDLEPPPSPLQEAYEQDQSQFRQLDERVFVKNGQPVWQSADRSRFLFFDGQKQKWYVGDIVDMQAGYLVKVTRYGMLVCAPSLTSSPSPPPPSEEIKGIKEDDRQGGKQGTHQDTKQGAESVDRGQARVQ